MGRSKRRCQNGELKSLLESGLTFFAEQQEHAAHLITEIK
jgi:hypothetical protein